MEHPLAQLFADAAFARWRGGGASLRVFAPAPGRAMAIVGLPGMHAIASSVSEGWVRERLAGDLMGPLNPRFIAALARELGRVDDGLDLVLAARGMRGKPALRETSLVDHPRLARAAAHRSEVKTFTDNAGDAVLAVGRGLAGRFEVSVEVAPDARGRGVARLALTEARRLVCSDAALFAQAAPANASSVRALLAAGFAPIGAEVLFFEGDRATT